MTNRMQFTVTGTKALATEVDINIHDLMTMSNGLLQYLQQSRVTHGASHTYTKTSINAHKTKAVIEIEGVYQN